MDESHPIQMASQMASELTQCRAIYVDGVGALGFIEHGASICHALFQTEPIVGTTAVVPTTTVLEEPDVEPLPTLLDVLPEPLPGE